MNQKKTEEIAIKDTESNQYIYAQYVKAFERGGYDFIKEDHDEATQEVIPGKYFSGGAEEDWRGKIEAGDKASLSEELQGYQASEVSPEGSDSRAESSAVNHRLKNRKVHVIGATSFLGCKLYDKFSNEYREVVGTGFQKIEEAGLVQLDVTSEQAVQNYFSNVSDEDIVIYAAGWTDVDKAGEEKARARALNADAVGHISKHFKGKLVYISTDNVFDGKKAEPYAISSETKPVNYYGQSKLQGEQIALTQFIDNPALVLRLGELYGFNDGGDRKTFARKVIDALDHGQSIIVDSEVRKGPILIDDVAINLLKLLDEEAQGIHQLNGPQKLTKYLWAQKIAHVWSNITGRGVSKIVGKESNYKEPRPRDSFMESDYKVRSVELGVFEMLKQMGIVSNNHVPEELLSIGVSVGGTKIGVGLVSGAGFVVERTDDLKWREEFGKSTASKEIVDGIMKRIEEVLHDVDDIGRVVKIGVAFGGPVDSEQGIVGTPFPAPNLPFDNYNLASEIRRRFNELVQAKYADSNQAFFEVNIYNDSMAAVLGEFNKGAKRGKHGMAFILGTGTNGAVITNGEVFTDNNALLELGFNLIRRGESGEWVFTGNEMKGDKPEKQSEDKYNIDMFSGLGIANEFMETSGLRLVTTEYVVLPKDISTVDEFFHLIKSEQTGDEREELKSIAIRNLLNGITKAVATHNVIAIKFIEKIGQEFGRSLAALIQSYYDEPWVEHIVLVGSIGELFAKVEDRDGEEDIFIRAMRDGLREALNRIKGNEGFEGLNDNRVDIITQGIERSSMDWEREILAAKLTQKDIHNTSIIPKEVRDRYTVVGKLEGGGSSAGTYLVRDGEEKEVVLKFATWAGIGSNGAPWLKAQVERLRELKINLPPLGASRIPEVYDYHEGAGLVYYTLEYLSQGRPLSLYHIEHPEETANVFLEDLNDMLTLMSTQFYSQERIEIPEGYVERVHLSRLKYRLGLLRKREGDVFERLIKDRPFKFGNERHRDISSLFDEVWGSETISINGQKYSNASVYLTALQNNPGLLQRIQPGFLPKYAHGDGLLRNFMKMKDGRLMVFDVRGVDLPDNSPARIDIPYELGKFLHGILLEVVRSDLFDLQITRNDDGNLNFELNYHSSNPSVSKFLDVREKMIELFEKHPELNKVLQDEPNWLEKALFAEATHFLADAINRLENDLSGRHTIAYYLIGTMLMNDCFQIL